ncbi:helix-turn-helix domain-containing protein [Agrobacterium sp. rho-13.3]|uniref:helix-turn-helix domain-containing protein n=1 Tax=Agrobacterium sp. rho-13.3 TaxID=3072980 RepID=UPI002A16E84C|nr:helix-turn-helix domain-containing protein [Agrobacterium sp. rho-13.3]MDX8307755.1 helix-turn-helix domain-containing protein [Agrobacterium sp. rho-13.3]
MPDMHPTPTRHWPDSRLRVVVAGGSSGQMFGIELGETAMRIQKLRLQRGWSQEQLATISGLSTRTIQRIERGQAPSLETLQTLAAIFEIDVSQLTEQEDKEMPITATNITEAEEAVAFARVRRIRAFYLHVVKYVAIIALLIVINIVTSPHYFWAIWPALGWGIGLIGHGLSTFEMVPFLNADWEKRQVEHYLKRKL